MPQTCHPRPAFCGIAFRAREVERHLLDLDPNGGVNLSGCFPMFFRKTASVLALKLSCLFRRLLRGGEFPLEWLIADVTPIPKGPLSALVCNYRPISITPVLSKIFERLIALRFGRFLERSGVLPSHKYSYRKRLATCDALLDIVCAGQLELDSGGELELIQIDFSVAFDGVNHGGLVFKLREAGVGGLILKVFQNFLSSHTQRVKVDGVFSSSIDVVSGVPQGSVLGPFLDQDNDCFSRCHCSCQVLLGIYTPCARVLFSSLDVCSHFSPVVAWSCCQPSWPSGGSVSCDLYLAQAQSGISECLLQDWQSGWSPCAWSFSSGACVEETNPWSLGCSPSIFRDA